jgi:hypothetical protein
MLRTVLQTGQRFLQFRQRVQALLQRLILSGGKCGLGIRAVNLAAVGDIRDAHPHSPAHHRQGDSRRKHCATECPVCADAVRQEASDRFRQNIPALIHAPVVRHGTFSTGRGLTEHHTSQRQRAVRIEHHRQRCGHAFRFTNELVGKRQQEVMFHLTAGLLQTL